MTDVYRILTQEQWKQSQSLGSISPNALDRKSGFMHLSGKREVLDTVARYFSADTLPIALRISAEALGAALKWEPVASRGGVAFPHLYADEIALNLVQAAIALSPQPGGDFTWGEVTSVTLETNRPTQDLVQVAE